MAENNNSNEQKDSSREDRREKERRKAKSWAREWFDALLFAAIAAIIIRTFLFEAYRIPTFEAPALEPGQVVRGVIGLDGGSTSSKAVLINEDGDIVAKAYQLSKGNPIQDTKELLKQIADQIDSQGASLECIGFGATGYAADVLEQTVLADVSIVETVAHMMSAVHFFGDVDVICDIGGQDIKVLFMKNGDIQMIINTPSGMIPRRDENRIRAEGLNPRLAAGRDGDEYLAAVRVAFERLNAPGEHGLAVKPAKLLGFAAPGALTAPGFAQTAEPVNTEADETAREQAEGVLERVQTRYGVGHEKRACIKRFRRRAGAGGPAGSARAHVGGDRLALPPPGLPLRRRACGLGDGGV